MVTFTVVALLAASCPDSSGAARAEELSAEGDVRQTRDAQDELRKTLSALYARANKLAQTPPPTWTPVTDEWRQAENERNRLVAERDAVLNELRSGLYCNQCWNTKSEIERGGTDFYAHLQSVQGVAVAAPQDRIDAKAKEYADRIAAQEQQIARAKKNADAQRNSQAAQHANSVREVENELATTRSSYHQLDKKIWAAQQKRTQARWCANHLERLEQEARRQADRDQLEAAQKERDRKWAEFLAQMAEENRARMEAAQQYPQLIAPGVYELSFAGPQPKEPDEVTRLRAHLEQLKSEREAHQAAYEQARGDAEAAAARARREEKEAAEKARDRLAEMARDLEEHHRQSLEALARANENPAPQVNDEPRNPVMDPSSLGPPPSALSRLDEKLRGELTRERAPSDWWTAQARREAERLLSSLQPSDFAPWKSPRVALSDYLNRVIGGQVRRGLDAAGEAAILDEGVSSNLSSTERAYRELWKTAIQIDVPKKYLPRLLKAASNYFGLAYEEFSFDGNVAQEGN